MSASSASFVRRILSLVVGFTLLALVALPGCGRSNLDDYLLTDGGSPVHDGGGDGAEVGDVQQPDNAACNATTCPTGCCDATGVCRAGAAITQCGTAGETCQNCAAEGFQLCDPTRRACGNPVASCDPSTCGGCCEGNVCFAGKDPNECGLNGQTCMHCVNSGLTCSPQQQCVQPPCGPQSCSGCCFGQDCLSGTAPNACGIKGAVCGNCAGGGGTCVAQGSVGGVCQGQTTCNASNCQGCCAGTVCLSGQSSTQCGLGGQQCSNCQVTGSACLPTGPQGGVCEVQTICTPQTCAGCCFGNNCLPGTDQNLCGIGGQFCQSCASFGAFCVGSGQGVGGFCESNPFCGPQNCPGCCAGNTCLSGGDSTSCGNSGQQCTDCTQFGEFCSGGDGGFGFCTPQPPVCNGQTCPGCCAGNTCLPGFDSAACGTGGKLCTDCTSLNETCGGFDGGAFGVCFKPPPPVCNAQTCPTGCCDGLDCLPGNLDSFCGTGGAACTNCGASNKSCKAQACVNVKPTCNATNCTGCCDLNHVCQPGFVDTLCGEGGASCQDCTQINPSSTCDVSVTPRLCQSEQVQCPAPYASCPGSLETPSPKQQTVCSQSDLQNAASACQSGAHTAACNSFFAFEKAQNPACASCMAPFDYDFSELQGLTTCVAPFTDATCNHITACLVDCTDKSCAQCIDSGALQQCQAQVPNSICASYYQDAQCIQNAFFGPGFFCDPNQGSGFFGDWLLQVGENYCAQPFVFDGGSGSSGGGG